MSQCRICKNSEKNKIIVVKQTGSKYNNEFEYVQCGKCKSLTIKEVPNNLSDYYIDYYSLNPFPQRRHSKIKSYVNRLAVSKFPSLGKLSILNEHPLDSLAMKSLSPLKLSRKHAILDVGCGSGKFIYDLHNIGFDQSIGIDPFIPKDIRYNNGARIYKMDLSDVSERYDIITFHHTMEHISDVDACLRMVKKILRPHGYCILRLPNISSYSARKFGIYWTGIHAPYHLCLPSYEAMVNTILDRNELMIYRVDGEQLPHFFLSNIDNTFDLIHDGRKMFREFAPIHTKWDIQHAKCLSKIINRHPELCEWINYYVVSK